MRHVLARRAVFVTEPDQAAGEAADHGDLDGRPDAQGYFHWIEVPGGLRVGFTPLIGAARRLDLDRRGVGEGCAKFPPHINVFRQSMLDSAGLVFADPATGMGPAIAKIVLGMAHFSYGRAVSGSPAFNAPRGSALKSGSIGGIVCLWWKSSRISTKSGLLRHHQNAGRAVSGVRDGVMIQGGVAFGGVGFSAEIQIPSLGARFEGRVLKVNLPF